MSTTPRLSPARPNGPRSRRPLGASSGNFATREEALKAAQFLADHFRRPALVYAIDAMGRSAVVGTVQPNTTRSKEITMTTKTFSSHFNAARGARRALGSDAEEGRDFLTKKRDGAWAWQKIEPAPEATKEIANKGENNAEAEALAAPASPTVSREATTAAQPVVAADPQLESATSIADLHADTHPIDVSNVVSAPTSKRAKRAALEEAAQRGELPPPPDFSAPTHARYRAKLDRLVAMAQAGDVDGLKAAVINPISSSPKAMARYRDLCVTALQVRRAAG